MPKKEEIVRFISFDIDNCLLPEESKVTMIDANSHLWLMLNRQEKHGFATSFTMLFSSRQSSDVNDTNRKHKQLNSREDPTSCYLPLKHIAEQSLGGTLCSVLLSDAYSERPDGYSYTRAVLKADDATAYHPGFVFDTKKTGLLYMQAHIAANNMRNCDFLSVAKRPTNIFQLPCKSNAAYLYIQEEKALVYVNKAKQEESKLPIKDIKAFNEMQGLVTERIKNEEHDFETLHEKDEVIKGITLSDDQIMNITKMTGHKHIKKDYLIILEAFDDLQDIINSIHRIYSNKSVYLPQNVIVRLNLYSISSSDRCRLVCTIRGTGPIDLKPKETVVKMAKQILKKEKLQEEDFYNETCFAQFISSQDSAVCFKTRSVVMPTVKHKQSTEMYAPLPNYFFALLPTHRDIIKNFIYEYTTFPSQFFFANQPIKYEIPILVTHLQTLVRLKNDKDIPQVLTLILDDKNYSNIIPPDSEIDTLLRKLDSIFNPKQLEEKHQESLKLSPSL